MRTKRANFSLLRNREPEMFSSSVRRSTYKQKKRMRFAATRNAMRASAKARYVRAHEERKRRGIREECVFEQRSSVDSASRQQSQGPGGPIPQSPSAALVIQPQLSAAAVDSNDRAIADARPRLQRQRREDSASSPAKSSMIAIAHGRGRDARPGGRRIGERAECVRRGSGGQCTVAAAPPCNRCAPSIRSMAALSADRRTFAFVFA